MRVFIVRHGETDWNVQHRFQGDADIPLNQNGINQAQVLANRLKLEKFDLIFSSPLQRALVTAKEIAKYHPQVPLYIETELKEASFGKWEGKTWEEISSEAGHLAPLSPHEEYINHVHGGESLEMKVEKLIPIVSGWIKKYKDKTILISTHGYTKKAILIAFKVAQFNESMQNQRFENTALSIIRPFDEEKIELLGDIKHLV